ncbi:MAG: molybdenum cofactor biosynthesis protein [Desulfobulbus propionicus]|nr:MAG: molybdenum cofactor biosynthesis protein [Desulfobulbus propionicus]
MSDSVCKTAIYTCGVLTLSDKGSRGERIDTSGAMLQEMLTRAGFSIGNYTILPDQPDQIEQTLLHWVDDLGLDCIITTGGTGVAPSDRTPEATRRVIELELPGLSEAMRMASLEKTIQAVWSRGIAGIRKQTLIINLPGSEKAARENLQAVLPALEHGLYKLKGGTADCGRS